MKFFSVKYMDKDSASQSDLNAKIAYVAMFLVAILWGLSWPFGRKIATADLGPVPFTSAFIRFGLAIPFLLIAVKVIERPKSIKLPKSMIRPVILLGLMQVSLHNFLLLTALRYTSGSDGVLIINGGITVFTVLLAPLVYSDEKITTNKLIGMIVAISGVGIIFILSPQQDVVNRSLGNFIILITALNWSLYTIFSRKYLHKLPPLLFQLWAAIFGWLILGIAVIIEQIRTPTTFISSDTWINLSYMVVFAAAIAYSLYNVSIKRIGSSRTSVFINLSPFFGVLSSVLILGEIFSIWYLAAFLVIAVGIYITEFETK